MSDAARTGSARDSSAIETEDWPCWLRIPPAAPLWIALGGLALALGLFLLVDILALVDLGSGLHAPLWAHLYHNSPLAWTQWLFVALASVGAAYLGGRLHGEAPDGAAPFFALLSLGLGLMLLELAGDVRHYLSHYGHRLLGSELFGLPHRVVFEVPYLAALAALPLYAVLRYGRAVWASIRMRPYLAGAFGLYALVGTSSGFRSLGDLYTRLGRWLDRALLGGRLPGYPGWTQARTHLQFVDGVVEESVELLAAALMLGAVLAFAADVRQRQAARALAAPDAQDQPPV